MADLLTDTYMTLRKRFRFRAQRILGSGEDADDVLQEAFYKLWAKRYPVRSTSEAEALLTTTVRNTSLDAVRRRREKVPLDVADPPAPEDGQERHELYVRVERLVREHLSDTQQRILDRMEGENVTLEQIAREINSRGLCVRRDGQPVTDKQVYAVIMSHPETFVKSEGRIRLMI